MSKKILVTMRLDERQKNFLEAQAKNFPCEFIYKKRNDLRDEDLIDVDWIIGAPPPELLPAAKNLEWLQIIFAGADSYLNLPPDILLTNVSGAYDTTVSNHMLTMTLMLARGFYKYARQQVNHVWQHCKEIISITSATVLILGAGNIGAAYAQKVKALGANVIGVRRTKKIKPDCFDEIYTVDELDKVLGRADIVAMILPGGSQTNHFMDEEKLSKLKRGAFLINVGRGNAVDPVALKKFLRNGHLGGVALDVTEPEPLPTDDELWDFDNVIITPHCAGGLVLAETRDAIVKICAENLRRKIAGEPLKNLVDRTTGY
ncbi:MAG: D-2-hydroxyacid dehydrogenase [Selenomonadaceae bacterium]|nr:D-2-hydroxyacid dehydrogenase [Selenomonadaceae bacterium]